MEAPQTTRQVVETVLLDPHERHKLMTFAYARFGIVQQDAEDLLQDTALELLRQRHYVHSPQGYLFTVFRMRCVRFFRDRKASGVTVEIKETHDGRSPVRGPRPKGGECGRSERTQVRE